MRYFFPDTQIFDGFNAGISSRRILYGVNRQPDVSVKCIGDQRQAREHRLDGINGVGEVVEVCDASGKKHLFRFRGQK